MVVALSPLCEELCKFFCSAFLHPADFILVPLIFGLLEAKFRGGGILYFLLPGFHVIFTLPSFFLIPGFGNQVNMAVLTHTLWNYHTYFRSPSLCASFFSESGKLAKPKIKTGSRNLNHEGIAKPKPKPVKWEDKKHSVPFGDISPEVKEEAPRHVVVNDHVHFVTNNQRAAAKRLKAKLNRNFETEHRNSSDINIEKDLVAHREKLAAIEREALQKMARKQGMTTFQLKKLDALEVTNEELKTKIADRIVIKNKSVVDPNSEFAHKNANSSSDKLLTSKLKSRKRIAHLSVVAGTQSSDKVTRALDKARSDNVKAIEVTNLKRDLRHEEFLARKEKERLLRDGPILKIPDPVEQILILLQKMRLKLDDNRKESLATLLAFQTTESFTKLDIEAQFDLMDYTDKLVKNTDVFADNDPAPVVEEIKEMPVVKLGKKSKYANYVNTSDLFSESFHLPADDFLQAMLDVMKLPEYAALLKILPHAGSAVCFVYQLVRADNVYDYTAAVFQYARLFFDMETVKAHVDAFVVETRSLWSSRSEAMSDTLHSIYSRCDAVLQSELLKNIRDFILGALSFKLVPREIANRMAGFLGEIKPMSTLEFVPIMFNAMLSSVRLVEAYMDGVTVWDFVLASNPIDGALQEGERTLAHKGALYSGLPVPGCMCRRAYIGSLTKVYTFLEQTTKSMSPLSPIARKSRKFMLTLIVEINEQQSLVDAAQREAPFPFILAGDPGIGKSLLLRAVFKMHSEVKGRVFDDSHVYHKQTQSDFWEMHDPRSQVYVHFSELGNMHVNLASKLGDPSVLELTSLCDSLPYPLNMAAVEKKGKVMACPEAVGLDTNSPGLNLGVLVQNPAAYKRRFYFITPTVKPEFRKENTTSLDPLKSMQQLGDRMDRWTFKVVSYVANGLVNTSERIHMDGGDIHEFEMVMKNLMREHIKVQAYAKNVSHQRYSGVSDTIRSAIHVRRKFCDCKVCYCAPQRPPLHVEAMRPISEELRAMGYDPRNEHHNYRIYNWFWLFYLQIGWYITAFIRNFVVPMCTIVVYTIVIWVVWLSGGVAGYWFNGVLWIVLTRLVAIRNDLISQRWYGYNAPKWHAYAHHAVVLAAMLAIYYKFWKATEANYKTEATSVLHNGNAATNAEINEVEDRAHCVRRVERVDVKNTPFWNAREILPIDPVAMNDVNSINAVMKGNMRRAIIDGTGETVVFGIYGSYAVANSHAFAGPGPWSVKIQLSGHGPEVRFQETLLRKEYVVTVSDDVIFFHVNHTRFKDVRNYLAPIHVKGNFESYVGGVATRATSIVDFDINDSSGVIKVAAGYMYDWHGHRPGFCGTPLLVSYSRGFVLAGIHCAGAKIDPRCTAASFTLEQIRVASDKLESISPYMPLVSESLKLVPLHSMPDKSPFCYESLVGIRLFGQTAEQVSARGKSDIIRTDFSAEAQHMLMYSLNDEWGRCVMGAPMMEPKTVHGVYYSPYNKALRDLDANRVALDPSIMAVVIEVLVKRLTDALPDMSPLTMETAINGVNGDILSRRINASTAAGFGLRGKKDVHIPLVDGTSTREPTEQLKRKLLGDLLMYSRGECPGIVYKASLKDEVRPIEKCENGSTRVFFGSPLDSLILQRMFLYPFYTAMMEHSAVFCTAVGIDMHSGTDEMVRTLLAFSETFLEGDYEKYDKKNPFEIGLAACTVIWRVLKNKGYSDYAARIVQALLSENMFPLIWMLGAIMSVSGMQPSGMYGTAENNSIRGIVMLLYAWTTLFPDLDFFSFILPWTYGDDLLAAIKTDALKFFNNQVYADFCATHYNMAFTSAQKSKEIEKFLDVHHASFLKRRFAVSPLTGKWVGRLEMSSIVKSACFIIPSKHVSREEQVIDISRSTLWEYFFHCETQPQFEAVRKGWQEILYHYHNVPRDVSHRLLPTFNLLMVKFSAHELPPDDEIESCPLVQHVQYAEIGSSAHISTTPVVVIDEPPRGRTVLRSVTQCTDSNELLSRLHKELTYLTMHPVEEALFKNISESNMKASYNYLSHPSMSAAYMRRMDYLARVRDIKLTITILEERRNTPIPPFVTESSDGMQHSGEVTNVHPNENMVDILGDVQDFIDGPVTITSQQGSRGVLPLGDFLKRPVLIASGNFTLGSNTSVILPVWDLMMNKPSIRAKFKNFAFFKARMHLRFVITGVPQNYGKVIVSYQPYPTRSDTLQNLMLYATTARTAIISYLSQSRECALLDIRENKPTEMVIPFIHHKNMGRLYNSSATAISYITPLEDFKMMGSVYFYTVSPPGSVVATTSAPQYYVQAWFEDVELGGATGTMLEIFTESGKLDERETGPLEKISSGMAQISSMLMRVPTIAPYATASHMAFSGLEKVSHVFGWSKPNVVDSPVYVKNMPYMNGANTVAHDTAFKISLDPKQEISVDARATGDTEDEMTLNFLAQRESLLTTFTIAATDDVFKPVWKCQVYPLLDKIVRTGASAVIVQPTALSFAALPFTSWRANIKFRFEIVASAFHRQKYVILHEPNVSQDTIISATFDLTKQQNVSFDLQDTQSVTLCVEWASPRAWRKMRKPLSDECYYTTTTGFGTYTALGPEFCNGMLYFVPMTDLVSPDGSAITVNVYVSCDDLIVNRLSRNNLMDSHYSNPAMVESKMGGFFTESGKTDTINSQPVSCITLNPSNATTDKICMEHFGERPVSLRSLLKRSVTTTSVTTTGLSGRAFCQLNDAIYPPIATPYGSSPLATYNGDLYSYMRYAYVGCKGSIKCRIRFVTEQDNMPHSGLIVSIGSDANTNVVPSITSGVLTVSAGVLSQLAGSAIFDVDSNGGVEVEFPFYSRNLFLYSFATDLVGTNDGGDDNFDTYWSRAYNAIMHANFTTATVFVQVDKAAGEDFTFMRFQGAPFYMRAF